MRRDRLTTTIAIWLLALVPQGIVTSQNLGLKRLETSNLELVTQGLARRLVLQSLQYRLVTCQFAQPLH